MCYENSDCRRRRSDCRYHIGRAYQNGYQCECVYDGAEAVGLLEEKRYDLILLDIMLPGQMVMN